jgi:CHAT domain-containing protein/tetratricopeptide (TPR) repeat protein
VRVLLLPAAVAAAVLVPAPGSAADGFTGALAVGEARRHTLALEPNRFVRLTVRKQGPDVAVRLLAADGSVLSQADTLVFPPGAVSVSHLTTAASALVVEIKPLLPSQDARYDVEVEERTAGADDERRIQAERAYLQAERTRIQGTAAALAEAQGQFDQALALARRLDDPALEGDALTGLARVRDARGDKPGALELFQRALALHRATGRDSALANTLTWVSLVHDQLGARETALDALAEAVAAGERCGDQRVLGLALNNTGLIQLYLGNKDDALFYYEQALPYHRAAGNLRGEANTLNGIGTTLDTMGEKKRALEVLLQALAVRETAGDLRDLAGTLNNIGFSYASIDEVGTALAYYRRALDAWRAAGDQSGEAATLHNVAAVHEAAAEYQQAISLWTEALRLFRATSSHTRAANMLTTMGRMYVQLGDSSQGVPLLEQALAAHRAAGSRTYEAAALANLGLARVAAGDYDGALPLYEEALALRRQLKDTLGEANSLREVARVHAARGDHERALALLAESQAVFEAISKRRGVASTQLDVARSRLARDEPAAALAAAERALLLFREVGDRRGEAGALFAAAQVESAQDALEEARGRLEAAIALTEELRLSLAGQELRTAFLSTVHQYYELLIDVLMRLHRRRPDAGLEREALAVSERARARSLLDVLAEARAEIREGVDPALLERERTLRRALNSKAARQARLWAGKTADEDARALAREIDTLAGEARAHQAELRARSPRYAELVQPRTLALEDIQRGVLDADTLLLEYALGGERSYAWAVTPDGVEAYELPGRAAVEERARRFYDAVREDRGGADAAGAALSEMVLAPVASRLAGRRRLLVVPDGALHLVPMAALPGPTGQPLVAGYEVVTLPSASTLAALREHAPRPRVGAGVLAVLADPVFDAEDPRVRARLKKRAALPAATRGDAADPAAPVSTGPPARLIGSRREAEAILARAPGKAGLRALDFEASRATATGDRLAGYGIVHFATHALIDHAHPELSGIVLSLVDGQGRPQDGVLRLHDVYNMRLAADLVVLSACQTALGPNVRGEGLIGLTRGFLYAGARRVVASLWRVDDAATAELMRLFYDAMLGPRRLAPAAALRAAQVEMSRRPRWAAPYHWAGFVLQGEWR